MKQFTVFGTLLLVVVALQHQPVSQEETIQVLNHHQIYLMEMLIQNILVSVVVRQMLIRL